MYDICNSIYKSLVGAASYVASFVASEPVNPTEIYDQCAILSRNPQDGVTQSLLKKYVDQLDNQLRGSWGMVGAVDEKKLLAYIDACAVLGIVDSLLNRSIEAENYFNKAVTSSDKDLGNFNEAIARILRHYERITKKNEYVSAPQALKNIVESERIKLLRSYNFYKVKKDYLNNYIFSYSLYYIAAFKRNEKDANYYANKILKIATKNSTDLKIDYETCCEVGEKCLDSSLWGNANENRNRIGLDLLTIADEMGDKSIKERVDRYWTSQLNPVITEEGDGYSRYMLVL